MEAVLKVAIFLTYMVGISKMKEIHRVFEYHGAEHKTIACYEAGDPLTVENVRKYTRFHPRCGTSFLILVVIVSVFLYSVLPWGSIGLRVVCKLLLLLLVMGINGEFTQTQEPCQVGADLVVGSLIKNPGGGIAPTGGYIAGRKDLVELCAYRLNAPGLGKELGCTLETPRDMYLGFYYAPGVVCEAIKTAIYAQCMLELLGKNPVPRYCDDHNDIVTCFDAGTADALIGFCQGIQAASPVDSYAAPEPSPEPGYTDEVVMASGSFTQGSTIELSCDGPLREPYTCYLQGGLNFAASRAGVLLAIQKAYFKD